MLNDTYLLGRDTKGKFRFAIVSTDGEWHEDERAYLIHRHYGQVGGKVTAAPVIKIARTTGTRTWKEQLLMRYNREVQKYKDKGYIETENDPNSYPIDELRAMFGDIKMDTQGVIKPQLAKQSEKITDRTIFNRWWMISRKLDGVKSLFYFKDGEIHTASRGGKAYDESTEHLRHNSNLIKFFKEYPKVVLDGELFKRGRSLQQISGSVRLQSCEGWIEYWIYDCYDPDNATLPAFDRLQFLENSLNVPIYNSVKDDDIESPVRILEHKDVYSWSEMMDKHNQYVSEGFEGAVITDPYKAYIPGSRGNQLIKIKMYKAEDFKVIGYELGMRGTEDMVFVCELPDGRTFKAMPIGDRALKDEYVSKFDTYKGHMAECTFFNYSEGGIPTQPKLRHFRFDLE